MYRRFIATIAAAAVALTALGSAPALANERDNARLLAAILGIAVVGKIIHDKNKDKDRVHQPAPRHKPQVQHHRPRQNAHGLQPRPLPRGYNRKLLPGNCLQSFDTRQGRVRMFGNRCLQRSYKFANRLPQHCVTRVRTHQGPRRGFEANCLRREGYSLARR
ncbi:MAG: hypothetical protein P1U53_00985 [Sulfitobacter sp.]|nr:hypothetical protein [Sulfitobacter sp.]